VGGVMGSNLSLVKNEITFDECMETHETVMMQSMVKKSIVLIITWPEKSRKKTGKNKKLKKS